MASGGLDAFLNAVIPLAVLLFFGFKLYEGVQEPVDKAVAWIKEQMNREEEVDPYAEQEIIYR